jgi:hypothetical protein
MAHLLEALSTFKANLEKEFQIQNVFEQKYLSFQSIIEQLKSSNDSHILIQKTNQQETYYPGCVHYYFKFSHIFALDQNDEISALLFELIKNLCGKYVPNCIVILLSYYEK